MHSVEEIGVAGVAFTDLALLDALGFRRFDVAEALGHRPARFVLGHPTRHVFGDAHLDVEAQLVIDVFRDVVAPEAQIPSPRGCLLHAGLGGASRAAKTAWAKRVQLTVSRRSCALPFGVNL